MALTEEQKRIIEMEERLRSNQFTAPTINQKHGLPAFMSFIIPGLGQMIKGEVGRGIMIFIITAIGYVFLIIPGLILHIWNIIDAYNKN